MDYNVDGSFKSFNCSKLALRALIFEVPEKRVRSSRNRNKMGGIKPILWTLLLLAMQCIFGISKYQALWVITLIRPKKESVLFPVTLPTLIFWGLLKLF